MVGFDKTLSSSATAAYKKSVRIASEESQYREYLKSLKDGKVTLRSEQKKLLEMVSKPGSWTELRKKQVDVKDLAALTAATGHEFAIFTGKRSKILIHGNSKSWSIPADAWNIIKEKQYEWTAHSHPTFTRLKESDEDIKTLELSIMISRETGRNIAGQKLIDKYGREFLIKNKEKLSFVENVDEDILTVTFTLHKHLDKAVVEKDGGIYVEEKHFPDELLTAKVNLKDSSVNIITD